MTFVVGTVLVAGLVGAKNSAPDGVAAPSPELGSAASLMRVAGAEASKNRCPSARKGLAFYRLRHSHWINLRGVKHRPQINQPTGCAYTLWLAHKWKQRSYQARLAYGKWHQRQLHYLVRDFRSWPRAVREVQRVFPGTESWLLSCSDAEGWNKGDDTLWQGYGGQPYSIWLRDSNTVGGPMQFRFGTFSYMYRAAYSHFRRNGFHVPDHLREWWSEDGLTVAWRSMTAQALAAGWARYTGEDNSHWSASWGNGC